MKKNIIKLAIVLLVCAAAIGGVFAAKDNIVIYLGIRAFRALSIGLIAAGGIATGSVLISSGVSSSRLQDEIETNIKNQELIEEQHRRQTARLSVDNKLDNETLRKVLAQKMGDEWSSCAGDIGVCVQQLTQMDDYQRRLKKLLESNGADTLNDTEDVLDQAEQGMCRNVRKIINYMEVADAGSDEGVAMIKGKIAECEAQNADILKQSREFVFALTEYLNKQGDSSDDISMLEVYKETILKSIREE